jgi:hypothetical protein
VKPTIQVRNEQEEKQRDARGSGRGGLQQVFLRNFDAAQGNLCCLQLFISAHPQQRKEETSMKRMLLIAAALAFLASVTGAYAWDQQATDDQMSYQASHGQSLPTAHWPDESSGRY